MYDVIAIGNISVDLYFKGNSLTNDKKRFNLAIGGKYSVNEYFMSVGGGGINVAIGIKRFGLHVGVMGKIGENQFKPFLLHYLDNHRVCIQLCSFVKDYIKISSILLLPLGERTVINYETPHTHVETTEADLKKLSNAKLVYFSNLPTVPLTERVKIMHHLSKNNVTIALNLGVKDCRRPISQIKQLIEKTDILILNAYEFSELIKHSYQSIQFLQSVIKYMPVLKDKIVVVTDGEKGSYAYRNSECYFQKAYTPKNIVDTLGAGDAYTAGFIAEYCKSEDIQLGMEKGAQYACTIIEKMGAN